MDANSIYDILKTLIGQVVTVINPQSYIPTITGYTIDSEVYQAKLVSMENGTVKILTEILSNPHKKVREKALQFIPVDQVKRVTISKSDRLISL